jgi:hypothetical protein
MTFQEMINDSVAQLIRQEILSMLDNQNVSGC